MVAGMRGRDEVGGEIAARKVRLTLCTSWAVRITLKEWTRRENSREWQLKNETDG